eukprot:c8693_g1_i1.p1 GENE.c8693_g1_i1~~c8693_g1_i1.p1  ORF type:complete len:497 (+),score=121.87 c8693_g1_i1:144-1493(+)
MIEKLWNALRYRENPSHPHFLQRMLSSSNVTWRELAVSVCVVMCCRDRIWTDCDFVGVCVPILFDLLCDSSTQSVNTDVLYILLQGSSHTTSFHFITLAGLVTCLQPAWCVANDHQKFEIVKVMSCAIASSSQIHPPSPPSLPNFEDESTEHSSALSENQFNFVMDALVWALFSENIEDVSEVTDTNPNRSNQLLPVVAHVLAFPEHSDTDEMPQWAIELQKKMRIVCQHRMAPAIAQQVMSICCWCCERFSPLWLYVQESDVFARLFVGLVILELRLAFENFQPQPPEKTDTSPSESYKQKGNAAYALRRFEEALEWYTKSLQSQMDATVLCNRAITFLCLGRPDEALVDSRSAVELSPQLTRAHQRLGQSLAALGRLEEAIESFNQSITLEGSKKFLVEAVQECEAAIRERNQTQRHTVVVPTLHMSAGTCPCHCVCVCFRIFFFKD